MAVKHAFASGKSDGADTTLVRPSNWNADHTIDAGTITLAHLAADAKGWEFLGSAELASSLATTGAVTIAARERLQIIVNVAGYSGGDIASLRFNGDAGANYWTRYIHSVAGGTVLSNNQTLSATVLRLFATTTTQKRSATVGVMNKAAITKTVDVNGQTSTGAAGTAAGIEFGGGEWVNTSAQITSVELRTAGGTITMPAGTGFAVFGKDF